MITPREIICARNYCTRSKLRANQSGGPSAPIQSGPQDRQAAALQDDLWPIGVHSSRLPRRNGARRDFLLCAATLQNFVTSLKWKLLIFMAGTTISNDSSPAARTAGPSISTLASASMTL